MRLLFWISIIISGMMTITGFSLAYSSTQTFNPLSENTTGGNGNIGLVFILFPLLIIIYFFIASIFVFERIHKQISLKANFLKKIYILLFGVISVISIYQIYSFHHQISPYFDDEISYLNPFSNDLFFNFWTFIACLCISRFLSFYLNKKTSSVK